MFLVPQFRADTSHFPHQVADIAGLERFYNPTSSGGTR
jgi:hypothetical protein